MKGDPVAQSASLLGFCSHTKTGPGEPKHPHDMHTKTTLKSDYAYEMHIPSSGAYSVTGHMHDLGQPRR